MLLAGGVACADDSAQPAALHDANTFAFALGVDLDDPATVEALSRFDLVVVDGPDASEPLVDELHDAGTLVLGYITVGTIEQGRSWSDAAQPFRLDFWPEWDEWYADAADPGFRALVVEEIAPPVLDRGVDGLFLDNVDMVSTHPEQADGMEELVSELDELVDEHGALLFAQNGDDVIDRFADHLDGWNREDLTSAGDPEAQTYETVPATDTASGLATIERLLDEGLLVTTTDYVADGDDVTAAAAVERSCDAGALPYVADINLERLPDPITCP